MHGSTRSKSGQHHSAISRSLFAAASSLRFLIISTRSGCPLGHHSIALRRNFEPMSSQLLSSSVVLPVREGERCASLHLISFGAELFPKLRAHPSGKVDDAF